MTRKYAAFVTAVNRTILLGKKISRAYMIRYTISRIPGTVYDTHLLADRPRPPAVSVREKKWVKSKTYRYRFGQV